MYPLYLFLTIFILHESIGIQSFLWFLCPTFVIKIRRNIYLVVFRTHCSSREFENCVLLFILSIRTLESYNSSIDLLPLSSPKKQLSWTRLPFSLSHSPTKCRYTLDVWTPILEYVFVLLLFSLCLYSVVQSPLLVSDEVVYLLYLLRQDSNKVKTSSFWYQYHPQEFEGP